MCPLLCRSDELCITEQGCPHTRSTSTEMGGVLTAQRQQADLDPELMPV